MFSHRLALALGCTVAELKSRMSSHEFSDWVAYYGLEPWGSEINGLRHGLTASVIYNMISSATGGKRSKGLEHFTIGVRHHKGESLEDHELKKTEANIKALQEWASKRNLKENARN